MSYDLHFHRPRPGLTHAETMDVLEDEYVSGNADPKYSIDARLIADSLLALDLDLEEADTELDTIELNPKDHEGIPIQVIIGSSSVGVSLPNWDFTPGQVANLRRYWKAIWTDLTKHGLVGYDSQSDEAASASTFDQVVSGAAQAQKQLKAMIAHKKPWWKVW